MTASTSAPTVYTGRATNWLGIATSAVLLVPLVALSRGADDDWRGFLPVLVLAAIGVLAEVATASSVRVTAGPQGLTIHWGALGWPRMHYRLGEVAEARVVGVPWWAVTFGLWWTPWRTTCTTRAGDALRLTLVSGRVVTVSVPDPGAAAAALRAAGV